MKLSVDKAKEIKMVFLNEIDQTRTIPGALVAAFWEFYSQQFAPGKYSAQPCTCHPGTWVSMIDEVRAAVNEALSIVEAPVVEAEAVVEEPKKKSKKQTADAVEDDKTIAHEASI
jgi:hypothetical protein